MKVVYATADVWVTEFLYVRRGEYFPADDPAVVAHPQFFTDDPSEFVRRTAPPTDPVLEQATAAPGEKRQRRD